MNLLLRQMCFKLPNVDKYSRAIRRSCHINQTGYKHTQEQTSFEKKSYEVEQFQFRMVDLQRTLQILG